MYKTLEFTAEELPVIIRLKSHDGTKDYVLVRTKQDRLLLNKPQESTKPPRF
jgi:hypothetical protein